jgi:hypothetical protein
MILVLAVAAWIFVISLVAGLCVAARAGDLAQLAPAPRRRGHREPTEWEPFERVEIIAQANAQPVRSPESGAPLLHGDGVAA